MDFEAIDPWNVSVVAFRWDQCRVDLKDNVVKGSAKVSAVNSGMPGRFRVIDVLTSSTVKFHCFDVRII